MQWICNIALFLVLSGILLEMIADTRYYKFARWVAGVILLLQVVKPLTENEEVYSRFTAIFASFDYALGTDKILEEIYRVDEQRTDTVLENYKETVSSQIDRILGNNGLQLITAELSVEEDGTITKLQVWAEYEDKQERNRILIPTVAPVNTKETTKKATISPLELYIREVLAEFYQMDENRIEVVIQEAD